MKQIGRTKKQFAIEWWNDWRSFCAKYGYTQEFARIQWHYYMDGVRDSRLADLSIWLLDNIGYNSPAE